MVIIIETEIIEQIINFSKFPFQNSTRYKTHSVNYSQITVDDSRITLLAPACEKNPTIFLSKHTHSPPPISIL